MRRIAKLLTVVLFITPVFVSAALVPCGYAQDITNPNGAVNHYADAPSNLRNILIDTECNLCDFGQLIQNFTNYLLVLAVPISIALFAWCGILFFTAEENPSQIEKAKSIFRSVLIGFAICISGWLIVQTMITAIVKQEFFNGSQWNNLQCADRTHTIYDATNSENRARTSPVSALIAPLVSVGGSGSPATSGQPAGLGGTYGTASITDGRGLSEQDARTMLADAGITVNNSNPCPAGGTSLQTGCTTVAGLSTSELGQLITLKQACSSGNSSCGVQVSAGTESHGGTNDPHAQGLAVDLSPSATLDNFIKNTSGFQQVPSFNGLTGWLDPATGNRYTYEPSGGSTGSTANHWHVDFKTR